MMNEWQNSIFILHFQIFRAKQTVNWWQRQSENRPNFWLLHCLSILDSKSIYKQFFSFEVFFEPLLEIDSHRMHQGGMLQMFSQIDIDFKFGLVIHLAYIDKIFMADNLISSMRKWEENIRFSVWNSGICHFKLKEARTELNWNLAVRSFSRFLIKTSSSFN